MRKIVIILLIASSYAHGQTEDVAAEVFNIIESKCLYCHRKGSVGSIALDSPQNVRSYSAMINYVVSTSWMPPNLSSEFNRDLFHLNELDSGEVALIQKWVEQGSQIAENSKTILIGHKSASQEFDSAEVGWKTDTLSMFSSFEHYGVYRGQNQVFKFPSPHEQDRIIKAIKFIPGNREIVRKVFIALDEYGESDKMDDWDPRYGYYSYGGWHCLPSEPFMSFWDPSRDDTNFNINQNWLWKSRVPLLLHIHYAPFPEPSIDSSSIVIFYEDLDKQQCLNSAPLISLAQIPVDNFTIERGKNKVLQGVFVALEDMYIRALMPWSHDLAKSWEVFVKYPDGNAKNIIPLFRIDDWQFSRIHDYLFKEDLFIPKGTEIHARVTYNNTMNNLYLPDKKPNDTSWGAGMFDEMLVLYGQFYLEDHACENPLHHQWPSVITQERFLNMWNTYVRLGKLQLKNENEELTECSLDHINTGQYVLILEDDLGQRFKKMLTIVAKNGL